MLFLRLHETHLLESADDSTCRIMQPLLDAGLGGSHCYRHRPGWLNMCYSACATLKQIGCPASGSSARIVVPPQLRCLATSCGLLWACTCGLLHSFLSQFVDVGSRPHCKHVLVLKGAALRLKAQRMPLPLGLRAASDSCCRSHICQCGGGCLCSEVSSVLQTPICKMVSTGCYSG